MGTIQALKVAINDMKCAQEGTEVDWSLALQACEEALKQETDRIEPGLSTEICYRKGDTVLKIRRRYTIDQVDSIYHAKYIGYDTESAVLKIMIELNRE